MKIKMSVSIVTIVLLLISCKTSSNLPTLSPQKCTTVLRRNIIRRSAIHAFKIGPWTIKSRSITVGKSRKRRIKIDGMLHGGIAGIIRNIVILESFRHTHPTHRVALHLRLSLHKASRIITSKVTVAHHGLIVKDSIGVWRIGIIRVHVVIWQAHGRDELVIGEVMLSLGEIVFIVEVCLRLSWVSVVLMAAGLVLVVFGLTTCWLWFFLLVFLGEGCCAMRIIALYLMTFGLVSFILLLFGCSKVFLAVGVVAIFLSLKTLSLLKVITYLCLISSTTWTLVNLSELFLPMSECASQVSFTEACLKLRTDASLKEFVEVRVVELYTSSSIICPQSKPSFHSLIETGPYPIGSPLVHAHFYKWVVLFLS